MMFHPDITFTVDWAFRIKSQESTTVEKFDGICFRLPLDLCSIYVRCDAAWYNPAVVKKIRKQTH